MRGGGTLRRQTMEQMGILDVVPEMILDCLF